MKKRIIGIISILIITSLIFAGCSSKPELTNNQKFEKVMTNYMSLKSYKMNFEGTMNMDINSDDITNEIPSQFLDIFKNIKINGTMETKESDKLADLSMNYAVNFNGLTLYLETYFDGDKFIVKYPVMPNYIVIDMNDLFNLIATENGTELPFEYNEMIAAINDIYKNVYPDLMKSLISSIKEEDIEYIDSYEFIVDEQKISSEAMKINLEPNMLKDYFNVLMESIKNNEELYKEIIKLDPDAFDSFADYQAILDEGIKEMNADEEGYEEAIKELESISYDFIIGYDKDYNFNNMVVNFNADIPSDESTDAIKMNMNATYSITDQNRVNEIQFPEINETNSIDIFQLMMPQF